MGNLAILVLIILTIGYWLTPLILIVLGLIKLKSKPNRAKNQIIIGVIMLIIGLGFCGSFLI